MSTPDGNGRRPVPPAAGAGSVRRDGGEDPWTGRVLAMVGGFSFDQSQFNRATQACGSRARRSSRSSIRRRSTTAIRPRPWCSTRRSKSIRGRGSACGSRKTTSRQILGPSTLRYGSEHSRNVMTVRLAQDIGMPLIADYAKRFGVYDDLPPYLSFALGAGETTLLRMVDGLCDDRQWRPAREADADRPHPGPLRPHHLQARRARMHRLRRPGMAEPAGAVADRPPRAACWIR